MTRAGPILSATILAPDFESALAAYCRDLGLAASPITALDPVDAVARDIHPLAAQRQCWLSSPNGRRWLHLVDAPDSLRLSPLHHHGWMALEVLVGDPQAVVQRLGPRWQVLGPPAALEVSPSIRATQVLGPCGELYYFTAVDAPVPPFDLPLTTDFIDGPFVGVVSCVDRDASATAWQGFCGGAPLLFDTRVTVLNRALQRPLEQRYALAVLQLDGASLVEIDQVDHRAGEAIAPAGLRAGLHLLEIAGDGPPGIWRGPSGERVLRSPRRG
jgi:hypothetical protein